MKVWVGITDGDWFRSLRAQPDVDEVNFWQPGGTRSFRTLSIGEPFLFKLHSPDNFIVGGGFFTHSTLLLSSLAWDAFCSKNGAASLQDMRRRIERYRRTPSDPHQDYTIGCIILQDPFFFERPDWILIPPDFSLNIQQGRTYDLRAPNGRALWQAVLDRLHQQPTPMRDMAVVERPMFGEPVPVRQRLGQGSFRVLLTDVYGRRCAITGEKALPVLEAAHIKPVGYGGVHRIDNGVLLRSDVHTLFDRGYVTISPSYEFCVSRKLKDDFDNGEHYYRLRGQRLSLPARTEDRPARDFLEWHADTIFHP